MNVKLRTEQHFEFLSLKMGCRGSSESTCVKMPHCWKSHELAQLRDCIFIAEFLAVCVKVHPWRSDSSVEAFGSDYNRNRPL